MYECIYKMTSMKLRAEICVCGKSKKRSQANWLMEKLHLCKWPLGAVLSVLEGLQGHYTHIHTHTVARATHPHTRPFRKECVCPGGIAGSLPY